MFLINSGSVNGMGDFSEDFAADEDLDARNKMFEEVRNDKVLPKRFHPLNSIQLFTGL